MAYIREERAPFDVWNARFRDWAKKEHSFIVFEIGSKLEGNPKFEAIAAAWFTENGLAEDTLTEEDVSRFWDERFRAAYRLSEEYGKIEPLPEDVIEPGSLRAQIIDALSATLRDLLRPVYLADGEQLITIQGEVEDSELTPVDPSPMAGYGIGGHLYDIYLDDHKREQWWKLLSQIAACGDGDLLAGLKLAAEALCGNREQALVRALEEIRDTAKSWEGRAEAPYRNLGDKAAAALKRYRDR